MITSKASVELVSHARAASSQNSVSCRASELQFVLFWFVSVCFFLSDQTQKHLRRSQR